MSTLAAQTFIQLRLEVTYFYLFFFFSWNVLNGVTRCYGLSLNGVEVPRWSQTLEFDGVIQIVTISIAIATNTSIHSPMSPMDAKIFHSSSELGHNAKQTCDR